MQHTSLKNKTVVITGAGDMAEVIGERILSEGGKRNTLP